MPVYDQVILHIPLYNRHVSDIEAIGINVNFFGNDSVWGETQTLYHLVYKAEENLIT